MFGGSGDTLTLGISAMHLYFFGFFFMAFQFCGQSTFYGTWKGKTCDVFLYFQKDYYRGSVDFDPAAFVWTGRAWCVYCGADFQCHRWTGMLYYHDCDRVSQTWQGIKLFLWIKQRCNTWSQKEDPIFRNRDWILFYLFRIV